MVADDQQAWMIAALRKLLPDGFLKGNPGRSSRSAVAIGGRDELHDPVLDIRVADHQLVEGHDPADVLESVPERLIDIEAAAYPDGKLPEEILPVHIHPLLLQMQLQYAAGNHRSAK